MSFRMIILESFVLGSFKGVPDVLLDIIILEICQRFRLLLQVNHLLLAKGKYRITKTIQVI